MIETIEKKMNRIKQGKDPKVKPGQAESFTDASSPGDCIRQGDLYLVIGEKIPKGFSEVTQPKDIHRQLVPGNTQGARHCLDSLDGVKIYTPKNFGPQSLVGPILLLSENRTVMHPTHGHVSLRSGSVVECYYQREFDAEKKRERRALD